jgi:hypothetical protein
MKWDQGIFNNNLERLIREKCDGVQNRFNEIVGHRDAATRWKRSKPSLDAILDITEKFKCSVDDLLSDPERGQPPQDTIITDAEMIVVNMSEKTIFIGRRSK